MFYSVAFLNLMQESPVGVALSKLLTRPVFSYGTVDTAGKLQVIKPDGTLAVADFAYLAKKRQSHFARSGLAVGESMFTINLW